MPKVTLTLLSTDCSRPISLVPVAVNWQFLDAAHVLVSSFGYVHAVELEGEYIFDDNYFSLLPGESRVVTLRPTPDAQSPVLSVNAYTVEL